MAWEFESGAAGGGPCWLSDPLLDVGAWRYTKRLYFRRRGAHCCCACPIMRMSDMARGETCVESGFTSVERDPGAEVAIALDGE